MSVYLYCLATPKCLTESSGLFADDQYGIDERHPVEMAQNGDIVAVIGTVDLDDFSEENLQSVEWVGPRAQRHEAIVEKVMSVSTVLPVKFGAIFASVATLNEFMLTHHRVIADALDDLADKAEYSVKVFLDEDVGQKAVALNDPAIQSKLETLSSSPGVRYMQQIKVDAMIKSSLGFWIEDQLQNVAEVMDKHCESSKVLRCHSNKVTGRSDQMVFNNCYLLPPDMLKDFRDTLADLEDTLHNTGLKFELQGPWPPYNFCPPLSIVDEIRNL